MRGKSGFTLLENTIGLGISSVILLAAANMYTSYSKSSMYGKAVNARNDLLSKVKALGESLKTLQSSANDTVNNKALYDCLRGASCDSRVESPLFIYEAAPTLASHFSGSSIGGNSPRFYTLDQVPCDAALTAATTECPLEVSTSFIPQCPSDPTHNVLIPPLTCAATPDVIQVKYSIKLDIPIDGKSLQPFQGTIVVRGPRL